MTQYNDGTASGGKAMKVVVKNKGRSKRSGKITRREVAKIAQQSVLQLSESKVIDSHFALNVGSSTVGTPIVSPIFNISQGSSENERDGNHVRPFYCGGRYTLKGNANSTDPPVRVRVMLIRWKQNTGATGEPTWGDLLHNQAYPFTYYLSNNDKSFTVLYDARHLIVNHTENEGYTVYGEWNLNSNRLVKHDISFNDTGTAGENKLYMVVISNAVDATTTRHPLYTCDVRLKYKDF